MASHWYDLCPRLAPTSDVLKTPTSAQVSELLQKAQSLHDATVGTSNEAKSESSFLTKVVASGTLSDRLSALTLLVQADPVKNTRALETLKGMAERGKGQGGRDESLKALRCIADWWVGGGAPSRKLRYFRDQPLLHPSVTDDHLLVWYFEDWLKKFFFAVLQILEGLSLDPLPYVRTQSLALLSTLLRDKPEQEHNLLRLLVNKLGDPEKQICSRASFHILQVLQAHPSMKAVIVREISALILRPPAGALPAPTENKKIRFDEPKSKAPERKTTTNAHARYYGAITLNQVVLSSAPADKVVATALLDVYFDMFRDILGDDSSPPPEDDSSKKGKKSKSKGGKDDEDEAKVDQHGRIYSRRPSKRDKDGEKTQVGAAGFTELEDVHARLVSAILTGVNRALPFAPMDGTGKVAQHLDTLFVISHTSTFNTSLQALVLIQQICTALEAATTSSADKGLKATAKQTKDRYYRALYASLHDPRLAESNKQAMYLNLLFKSIKADARLPSSTAPTSTHKTSFPATKEKKNRRKGKKVDEEKDADQKEKNDVAEDEEEDPNARIVALIRRFVQVLASSGSGTTEFVAGGLFLLGELFSTIPGLRSVLTSVPRPTTTEVPSKASTSADAAASHSNSTEYDPYKRTPTHAHALSPSSFPLFELIPLTHHFHPAISLHAKQLLGLQPLTASADLSLNTLSHFLDRFVYKNAKKLKSDPASDSLVQGRGVSAMQPAASATDGVKLVRGELAMREGKEGGGEMLMNDPRLLARGEKALPVDQRFFFTYFANKAAKDKAKSAKVGKRKGGDDAGSEEDEASDDDDVDDDEEEEKEEASDSEKKPKKADADEDEEEEEDEEGSDLDEDEVWKAMQASMPKADELSDLDLSDEDSEPDLAGLSMDSSDDEEEEEEEEGEDLILGQVGSDDEDSEGAEDGEDEEEDDWEDEEDMDANMDDDELAELSDNDDLLPLDAVHVHHIPDDPTEEEWGGIDEDGGKSGKKDKKRKRGGEEEGGEKETARARRKKLRSLPTFASYEDYAKMIEDGPEDNI